MSAFFRRIAVLLAAALLVAAFAACGQRNPPARGESSSSSSPSSSQEESNSSQEEEPPQEEEEPSSSEASSDDAAQVFTSDYAQLAGLDQTVVEPVFKTVVLSILTKLTSEICRSAGEGGLAAAVETAGTVLALAVTLPLVHGVLTLMGEMLL